MCVCFFLEGREGVRFFVVEKPKNPSVGDVMCVCVCGGFERGPDVEDVVCVLVLEGERGA